MGQPWKNTKEIDALSGDLNKWRNSKWNPRKTSPQHPPFQGAMRLDEYMCELGRLLRFKPGNISKVQIWDNNLK